MRLTAHDSTDTGKHALGFVAITDQRRVPASLYSLSSILGPPLMTQLFGRFSSPVAPVHLPGAAFLAATVLATACFAIYWNVTQERAAPSPEPQAVRPYPVSSHDGGAQPER